MSTTSEQIARGQHVLARLSAAKKAFETCAWPALEVVVVRDQHESDDEETVLVCPWCDAEIRHGGGLYAVDLAERWTYVEHDSDLESGEVLLDGDVDADFGDTLYYAHEDCEKPVRLPEGWTERWL